MKGGKGPITKWLSNKMTQSWNERWEMPYHKMTQQQNNPIMKWKVGKTPSQNDSAKNIPIMKWKVGNTPITKWLSYKATQSWNERWEMLYHKMTQQQNNPIVKWNMGRERSSTKKRQLCNIHKISFTERSFVEFSNLYKMYGASVTTYLQLYGMCLHLFTAAIFVSFTLCKLWVNYRRFLPKI